jgi:hypothetical protein
LETGYTSTRKCHLCSSEDRFNYIGDFHTFLLGVKSLENHAFSKPLVYLRVTAPAADPGKQEGLTSV